MFHIAVCYPGTDLDVEHDVIALGFKAFRMTLPTPDRKSAFPGYMFVDPSMNPFIHPVDGITDFLMIGEHYAAIHLDQLLEIQRYIDRMITMPSPRMVYDAHFSQDRPLDFFDTPGKIIFEKSVNVQRFGREAERAVVKV